MTFYKRKDALQAQNDMHNIKTLSGVSFLANFAAFQLASSGVGPAGPASRLAALPDFNYEKKNFKRKQNKEKATLFA